MSERKSHIQKGETASNFTLKDQNGQEFKLSDFWPMAMLPNYTEYLERMTDSPGEPT